MAREDIGHGKKNIEIKKDPMQNLSETIPNTQAAPAPLLMNYGMLADLFFFILKMKPGKKRHNRFTTIF